MLYANLLSKDAQFQCDKIVSLQVDTDPWTDVGGKEVQCDKVVSSQVDTDLWTDVRGKEQSEACTRSYTPFMYCVTLHLQMVFAYDAAEKEILYL